MEQIIFEEKISKVAMLLWLIIDIICCAFLIGFVMLAKDLIHFFGTSLVITTRTVQGKTGFIHKEELDSPLNKITGVKVDQGVLGQIFNYGTIHITTANTVYSFEKMDRPKEFKALLNQQIDKYEEDQATRHAQKLAQAMRNQ